MFTALVIMLKSGLKPQEEYSRHGLNRETVIGFLHAEINEVTGSLHVKKFLSYLFLSNLCQLLVYTICPTVR